MNTLPLIHFTFKINLSTGFQHTHDYCRCWFFICKWSLEETTNICVGNLYNGNENPPNIPRHDFRNLINIAIKESFFTFSNKYYKQVYGAAMRSPLGQALTFISMSSFERKWLQDCSNDFNLCSIDVMLMKYLHYFLLLIMQINLRSIYHPNIPT